MASFNPHKIANKLKRQSEHVKSKKQKESTKRDERLRRRRTEDKNPRLRDERRAKNVPATIDSKRTWDEATAEEEAEGGLGLSVNILNPKRRKVEEEPILVVGEDEDEDEDEREGEVDGVKVIDGRDDDEIDSMLGSDSDSDSADDADDDDDDDDDDESPSQPTELDRLPSEAPSTATDLNLTPEALALRFPTLFNPPSPPADPKVLITTSLHSPNHREADLLTTLFPNSTYIRRTAHAHSHKYSIREIATYASARDYTTLIVLKSERKKPVGLDVVHLPEGPMLHFTISNWTEGKKLPGHGNPTGHWPELILNNFRTPLGLLAAHSFKALFPPHPQLQGRQVVTLHNQRDYIFVRRHRYVFRDRKGTEKKVQGADGKAVSGVEEIRAGLQELGPRFTLKLRRVDKGLQRASGVEWEWKAKGEKVRTRFSL